MQRPETLPFQYQVLEPNRVLDVGSELCPTRDLQPSPRITLGVRFVTQHLEPVAATHRTEPWSRLPSRRYIACMCGEFRFDEVALLLDPANLDDEVGGCYSMFRCADDG